MPKFPRNLSGKELIKAFEKLGYRVTRQRGSHVRLTTTDEKHHVTIPNHDVLRVGTLAKILSDTADYHQITRDEIIMKLFD